MTRFLTLVAVALMCAPVFGAVETTTINGNIVLAGGATATGGEIRCQLSDSATADDAGTSQRVGGRVETTIAANGSVSFTLVPNDVMTPAGTYYTCRVKTTGAVRASWTELWSVASSPDPVDIGAITRLEVAPGITVGDFMVYVDTEPSGACTTADVPTFAEDNNTICECVASVWSCSALGGTPGADSITTNELSDGVDTPLAGQCVLVAAGAVDFEYDTCPGGGGGGFDTITTGTNTTATMTVGTGASIVPTGTGTITATSVVGAAAEGTCTVSERGQVKNIEGAGGTADQLVACMKSSADTYNWILLADGGGS